MKTFLSVLPLAIDIAKIAEAAVPEGGKGKAKLAFAVDTAAAIYETEEDLRTNWGDRSKFLEAIVKAVGLAVSLLNAAGLFRKTQPATT